MTRYAIVLIGLLVSLSGGGVRPAEPAGAPVPVLPAPGQLAGHTLNAVTYFQNPPGSKQGGLARLMVQAYLQPGGRALVRVWDAARDAYSPLAERRWSLDGRTLCLDLPMHQLCAEVHIWGPRISGAGSHPYAMLDGDLQPGNTITGRR
jgi:hypothetical protein